MVPITFMRTSAPYSGSWRIATLGKCPCAGRSKTRRSTGILESIIKMILHANEWVCMPVSLASPCVSVPGIGAAVSYVGDRVGTFKATSERQVFPAYAQENR
jgi:hypothetical protein